MTIMIVPLFLVLLGLIGPLCTPGCVSSIIEPAMKGVKAGILRQKDLVVNILSDN